MSKESVSGRDLIRIFCIPVCRRHIPVIIHLRLFYDFSAQPFTPPSFSFHSDHSYCATCGAFSLPDAVCRTVICRFSEINKKKSPHNLTFIILQGIIYLRLREIILLAFAWQYGLKIELSEQFRAKYAGGMGKNISCSFNVNAKFIRRYVKVKMRNSGLNENALRPLSMPHNTMLHSYLPR